MNLPSGSGMEQPRWRGLRKEAGLHLRTFRPLVFRARLAVLGGGAGALALAAAASGPVPGESGDAAGVPRVRAQRFFTDFGHGSRRATDTFLVINVLAFALQWLSKDMLTLLGAKVNSLISAGQLWRLVTPTFLHSGVVHLLVNSYALNSFGPHVEVLFGSARFTTIYLTSAVAGTLASYMMTPSPAVGCSGALFGIGAALGVFYWRHKEVLQHQSDSMLRSLGITVAINLAYSLLVKNIDNWGHLGGMLGGAALAWALGPRLVKESAKFMDRPPLNWMAFPYGIRIGSGSNGGPSGSGASSSGSSSSSNSSGSGSALSHNHGGKSSGRGEKEHRKGQGQGKMGPGSPQQADAGRAGLPQQPGSKLRPRHSRSQGEGEG